MNSLAESFNTENFAASIEAAIRASGEVTREELIDAVFLAMEAILSTLVVEGAVELIASPHTLSHLDVFRAGADATS